MWCMALLRGFFAILVLQTLNQEWGAVRAESYDSRYCLPGLDCWPSIQELTVFTASLSGTVFFPFQPEYNLLTIMKNTLVTKFPAFIVLAKTTNDVQKSLFFAKKFNIKIAIQSSGHDFQGRSTAHSCMQIYLGNMTNIEVKLQSNRSEKGEITIGTGAKWLDVYTEVDKYDRVVVGGSAHTVSIGGYTLGGGHSPMSRMFGLAADNLLEVEMVTADGNVRIVQENITKIIDPNGKVTPVEDKELFWALRGGGGGTYGIATKFTFKLHQAAPSVVRLSCGFRLLDDNSRPDPAVAVLAKLAPIIFDMPNEWGGYITVYPNPAAKSKGGISIFMNHYGGWDTDSRRYMDELVNFRPDLQTQNCTYTNYSTFLGYENTVYVPVGFPLYLSNTLVQKSNFNEDFISFIISNVLKYPEGKSTITFTGILIGGKVMDVGPDDSPLHPGFRTGYMELASTVAWSPESFSLNDKLIAAGIEIGNDLQKFGTGMYRNEASGNILDWKTAFWGNHYDRLLKVKQSIDPTNIFNCFDCVGEFPVEVTTTTSPSTTSPSKECVVGEAQQIQGLVQLTVALLSVSYFMSWVTI